MNAMYIKNLILLIIGLCNFLFQTISPMKRVAEEEKIHITHNNFVVLSIIYEQLFNPLVMEKAIYKIILDRCMHKNGHISNEALFTLNDNSKFDAKFKHYRTNIKTKIASIKSLRATLKALCDRIKLEKLYELEKAYLKIDILTQLLMYTHPFPNDDHFDIKMGHVEMSGRQLEVDLYIKSKLKKTIVFLNKLYNFGYKRDYQQKHTLLNKCAAKINNTLFCITLFAIQYQPIEDDNTDLWYQDLDQSAGTVAELQEMIEAFQNFLPLSLFLFADHQKKQRGFIPASFFVETERNVIPPSIRNIIKQQIKLVCFKSNDSQRKLYPKVRLFDDIGKVIWDAMSSDSDNDYYNFKDSFERICFSECCPLLKVSFDDPVIKNITQFTFMPPVGIVNTLEALKALPNECSD